MVPSLFNRRIYTTSARCNRFLRTFMNAQFVKVHRSQMLEFLLHELNFDDQDYNTQVL